jgi:sporulation and spore germination protein
MHSLRSQFTNLIVLIVLGLMAGACSAIPSANPTATSGPAGPTTVSQSSALSPTAIVVTATLAATTIPSITPVTPAAVPPTQAPPATATPVPAIPLPAPRSGGFTRVKIFLIAMNDNGKSGPLVGCGDSVIGVDREIPPTVAPLTAALNQLFSLHDQFYGQSGLYNALYQSHLAISSVAIVGGRATIRLTGQLSLGGECDDPRVDAQITQTALQFSTVHAVDVFVNGIPLKQLLSGK